MIERESKKQSDRERETESENGNEHFAALVNTGMDTLEEVTLTHATGVTDGRGISALGDEQVRGAAGNPSRTKVPANGFRLG